MSLDHILLGYLRQPASGYELNRQFQEGGRHFWFAELSQIYPTLKRLEAKGWLRSREAPSERGPARRVYQITATGRRALRRWVAGGPHIGRERLAFVAQTFFLDALEDPAEAQRVVEAMREVWSGKLADLEKLDEQIQAQHGHWSTYPPELFYPYSAVRSGIHQYRGKLAWCEETLARIAERGTAAERPVAPMET